MDTYERIDKYIRGEMEHLEMEDFKLSMQNSPQLKADYTLVNDIAQAIQETEIIQLRKQLNNIHSNYISTNYKRIIPLRWIKVAAAAVIITIVSSVFVNSYFTSREDIIANYYKPYESVMRLRSITNTQDNLQYAMSMYNKAKYKDAVHSFEKYFANGNTSQIANLYAGISYMEINQFENSIQLLSEIADVKNSPYAEQAQWYLGFVFLKNNQLENAKIQFEEIANSKNNYYQKKALKISKKLQRLRN